MHESLPRETSSDKTSSRKTSLQKITRRKRDIRIEQRVRSTTAGELDLLVAASLAEQYDFVQRLQTEWCNGSNRFDKEGEAVFVAVHAASVVGVCGINQDPYTDDRSIGRLRHLYVDPNYRSERTGYRLVAACIEYARPFFSLLRLRMARADTAEFYRRSGFAEVHATHASHEMRL